MVKILNPSASPFATIAVGALLSIPVQAATLPEGEGKAVVERICARCHTLDRVMAKAQDKSNWIKTVQEMLGYGAAGTDKELDTIVNYLAANFPEKAPATININRATVIAMVRFLEISPDDAQSIVDYREKNGAFKAWADLEKVPGVDLKKIAAKKDQVIF